MVESLTQPEHFINAQNFRLAIAILNAPTNTRIKTEDLTGIEHQKASRRFINFFTQFLKDIGENPQNFVAAANHELDNIDIASVDQTKVHVEVCSRKKTILSVDQQVINLALTHRGQLIEINKDLPTIHQFSFAFLNQESSLS